MRHIFTAGFTYEVPAFAESRLAEGWQVNAIITMESGIPFNIRAGTNVSGVGDFVDRAVQVGDPFSGITQSGQFERFFNAAAFGNPAPGTFSTLPRNAFHGPSFRTVDLSIFKTTKLAGSASLQLRAEIFNVFNIKNWANPATPCRTRPRSG